MVRSIPDETIRRIKNTADIVDVIAEHVVLKKAGRNHVGLCPFHAEKTPSFSVNAEKQIFYCFGCHTGGNVISFLMQKEGLSFPDAIRKLAARYGLEVPTDHLTAEQKERLSEHERLFRINEAATKFFQQVLQEPQKGQKAMTYLLGRGMTRKIIDGFQLGYAPDRWDALFQYFQGRRAPVDLLSKAGLVVPRKDRSGCYDRFRNRVIFPIFNVSQQVIGFGGRVMGAELPKYLNSPETPLYNKRRCLYGIHAAQRAARDSGKVYVVEGYFDVLAMHLYGIENTVATLGTALTPEHVQLLKGMVGHSGQVFLVYDSDQAGIKAAQRSVPIFEAGFLDARVIILPRGQDPDSFLREFGPDDFFKAADKALGMVSFVIDSAIHTYGLTLEGKIRALSEIQETLAAVQDTVARSLYIKQAAEKLEIDEAAVMEKVRQITTSRQPGRMAVAHSAKDAHIIASTDGVRLEQQIVAMLLCYSPMIPDIVERDIVDHFEDATLQTIARKVLQQHPKGMVNIADLVSEIEEPSYRNLIAQLSLDDCHWDRQGCERVLVQFEARYRRRKKENLQRQIEAAEKSKDMELLSKLLRLKQLQAGKG